MVSSLTEVFSFGRAGVECYCQHDSGAAVIQLQFLVNEGALVSALADDSVHLWNLRQKQPAILHTLKFNRERITFCHLPFQSKWLYIGTEKGNIHIVNVESFTLSGYVIMWNKAIELSSKSHPGPVVHISDNPMDEGKVGTFQRTSNQSFIHSRYPPLLQAIHSVAWHHEGKQFTCSHSDGTLTTWNVRVSAKPTITITPHGKQPKDGKKPEPCKPILKVEYKTTRAGDAFVVMSGGLSYDTGCRRSCLTVMHGKSTAVLEMDYPIVDFLTLCETPYPNGELQYYSTVTETPYPNGELQYYSTVTETPYPNGELQYYSTVTETPYPNGKLQYYSTVTETPYPNGKLQYYSTVTETPYPNGELQYYSTVTETPYPNGKLQYYKLSTTQRTSSQLDTTVGSIGVNMGQHPCGTLSTPCRVHVPIITLSPQLLEVRMQGELNDVDSPDPAGEHPPTPSTPVPPSSSSPTQEGEPPEAQPFTSDDGPRDNVPCLKVRSAPLKQSPGYQVELVIQLVWVSGEPPQQITSLAVNSSDGLVVFGNSRGLAVVDYLQKSLLLNMSTSELYSPSDPYQRQPQSPRKTRQPSGDIPPVTSCMSRLSIFYTSMKKTYHSSNSRKSSHVYHSLSCLLSLSFSLSISLVLFNQPFLSRQIPHTVNFVRSRSSSVTSIERESREAISSFHFSESFPRKTDSSPSPSLWLGTTQGTVLVLSLSLPPTGDQRLQQPVGVSSCGTLVRLKGGILTMAFLDSLGAVLPPSYEPWSEPNAPDEEKTRRRRPTSPPPTQEGQDSQYAVVCSEKQAMVVGLPSQSCFFKHNITESSFVLRADVVQMAAGLCLACFCANGHIMTLSLPSLRPLLDVNYLPLTDMRIARTFCFSNLGQALYLTSPTEIQRITYSQETCDNLQEMMGELFTPLETPEAPNRGFFKGLFGGGAQSLDREDLFGETAAGKASRSLAQHIPGPQGMEGMKGAASGVVGDLARARIALDERGQKLGELEDRTAAMMASADSFSKHAHDMMLKYKDKKWYQL
uniref:Syntaxin-binding protein 5-like n=1 Tax=Hucho hucho TaxID=62062 RepID=A0A4W5RCI8_9TELE